MESIGEKLRLSREEKGFSIDRVARDTNVARKYLEALENEDFAMFPGEPYLIGFLRIYSEYLGLDPQSIINLYKNFKIQEQPVPIDELLNKRDPRPFIIGGLIAVGAVILFLLVYLLVPVISNAVAKAKEKQEQDVEISSLVTFSGPGMLEEFSVNEGVKFVHNGKEANLVITDVNRDGTVDLKLPDGDAHLGINEEKVFSLPEFEGKRYSVLVSDVYTTKKSVSLYINRLDDLAAMQIQEQIETLPDGSVELEDGTVVSGTEAGVVTETAAAAATPAETQAAAAVPATDTAAARAAAETAQAAETAAARPAGTGERTRPVIVIMTNDRQLPFTVEARFDEGCLFRYQMDKSEEIIESYYSAGKYFRVEPLREMTFWASNAGSFNLYVSNRSVQVGQNGEVVVGTLRWRLNENKKYALEFNPQY